MKLYSKIKNKINGYFNQPIEPPTYETKREILNKFREEYNLQILVETGTFL